MRILVAASDPYTRESLLRAAGDDAIATGLDYLPRAMRSIQPDVLVIDAGGDSDRARQALDGARAAVETAVPAVLVVGPDSRWLREAPPVEVLPCVLVVRGAARTALADAVRRLQQAVADARVSWSPTSRELAGPCATVHLTVSEGRIFDAVFRAGGELVPAEEVATALWGEALMDPLSRAAIRTHVYTLRKKLRTAGVGDALVSLAGTGYRFRASAN